MCICVCGISLIFLYYLHCLTKSTCTQNSTPNLTPPTGVSFLVNARFKESIPLPLPLTATAGLFLFNNNKKPHRNTNTSTNANASPSFALILPRRLQHPPSVAFFLFFFLFSTRCALRRHSLLLRLLRICSPPPTTPLPTRLILQREPPARDALIIRQEHCQNVDAPS